MRIAFLILVVLPVSCFSQTWLWEVSKKGLKHKSYLFGTFHDMGNWYLDSLSMIKDFIVRSELVMVEKVLENEHYATSLNDDPDDKPIKATADLLNKLITGQRYWNRLLPDTVKAVFDQFINKYQMGGVYLYSPSDVFLTILRYYAMDYCDKARRPSDTVFRMDHYIEILARNKNIEVIGLDDQMENVQDSVTRVGKIGTFSDTVFVLETVRFMKLMLENRRNIECQAIDEYVKITPPFYLKKARVDTVFNVVDRNNYWVGYMLKYLPMKKCFIASGYEHLRFKDGLITQLRKRGYKVKPVKM